MFTFLLPNGKNIQTSEVLEALSGIEGQQAFFDINSGRVEWLPDPDSFLYSDIEEELAPFSKKIDDELNKRYFLIEALPTRQQYNWMKNFAEDIVLKEDKNLAEKLFIALEPV